MSDDDEVTVWLKKLEGADPEASRLIWEKYFGRLVSFARRRLESIPCRAADEEDVALSAMHSFCRYVGEGRAKSLNDRDDLWKLLVTIAGRKVHQQRRRQMTQKRRGEQGESVFMRLSPDDSNAGIHQAPANEPTPEFAVEVADECENRLARLDEAHRQVALYKLAGLKDAEIAAKVGCSIRMVEMRMKRIREKWTKTNNE